MTMDTYKVQICRQAGDSSNYLSYDRIVDNVKETAIEKNLARYFNNEEVKACNIHIAYEQLASVKIYFTKCLIHVPTWFTMSHKSYEDWFFCFMVDAIPISQEAKKESFYFDSIIKDKTIQNVIDILSDSALSYKLRYDESEVLIGVDILSQNVIFKGIYTKPIKATAYGVLIKKGHFFVLVKRKSCELDFNHEAVPYHLVPEITTLTNIFFNAIHSVKNFIAKGNLRSTRTTNVFGLTNSKVIENLNSDLRLVVNFMYEKINVVTFKNREGESKKSFLYSNIDITNEEVKYFSNVPRNLSIRLYTINEYLHRFSNVIPVQVKTVQANVIKNDETTEKVSDNFNILIKDYTRKNDDIWG
jgi:hypothetical protein